MEKKIENAVDGLLDNVFGQFQSQVFFLNIIGGIILVILGLGLLKNKSTDGKRLLGWIAMSMGCLGLLSGVAQLINFVVS